MRGKHGPMRGIAAAVVGLIWANLPGGSYETVWTTRLAVRLGGWGITEELRRWVNDGLMTFFFFVIGLEVRRELDMGELRERRRVAVPVLAALGGMVAPALIYLAINAGGPGARAWGVPMPTDTALALVALAIAILFFGVVYLLRFLRFWRGQAYFVVGVALWAAMLESGVHPAVAGV